MSPREGAGGSPASVKDRGSIVIRLDGEAGDGILSTGQMVARAAARCGYEVYTHASFLAEVRGGASTFQVRIGPEPLMSPGATPDVVVSLSLASATKQAPHVRPSGFVLHPVADGAAPVQRSDLHALPMDFKGIAASVGANPKSQNIVAAAALAVLIGLDVSVFEAIVRQRFKKNPEVAEANARAVRAGAEAAAALLNGSAGAVKLPPAKGGPRLLLSGNEAVALGALVGGVRFYAGYPITPASEIMEVLAKYLPKLGGRMVQAEDEIASIGMCLGAAFGGHRAMTATSGPGLSLMAELLGHAGMSETPVVIIDVQRAGPSTGMPTKDAQADLNFAIYGTHDEIPHAVLAAQSVRDCFYETVRAVNVAHQFHVPVIVLSNQAISHSEQTLPLPDLASIELFVERFYAGAADGEYRRFRPTADGSASPRSIPGTPGGEFPSTGLEHTETGLPSFDPENRTRMVARRASRMRAMAASLEANEAPDLRCAGPGAIGVLGWGSAASAAREAALVLREQGRDVGAFFPRVLWPLPERALRDFFASGVRQVFVCETNSSGQLATLMRAHFGRELVQHGIELCGVTKDDGTPLSPAEIERRITEQVAGSQRSPDGSERAPGAGSTSISEVSNVE